MLVALMCLVAQINAQYDLLYQHMHGDQVIGPEGVAIVDDGQGNTCLAGHFTNQITLGSFTLTTIQYPYTWTGFVGKFNSNSNTWLWAKQITLVEGQFSPLSYVRSRIKDMAMDNAGNIYITGHYMGTIKFDNIQLTSTRQGSVPTPDVFVAKLNANGTFLWAKSLGSKAGSDSGETIALDASNNVFIAGYFTNKIVDCGFADINKYDIFLAKLNNAGTTLWQKRYASNLSACVNGNMYANDVSTDGSGNVYMTGSYVGTVSFGNGTALSITASGGTTDVFTAKVNGSGTTQWVKSQGGSASDRGDAIYTDVSGNVYVGGAIAGAFLTKYNSSGGLMWSVNPFPASTAYPSAVVTRINPYSGSLLVNDYRIGFKRISMSDGSIISSDSLIGNELLANNARFSIRDVDISGSGFVFNLTGKCGAVSIDNLILTGSCGASNDIFMVRNSDSPPPAFQQPDEIIDPLSSFQAFAVDELEVYPNPANDQLHVKLPEHENEATLLIQNLYGRTVWSGKFDSQSRTATISLDGQSFQSGIYYLICHSNGEVKTERFVIDR